MNLQDRYRNIIIAMMTQKREELEVAVVSVALEFAMGYDYEHSALQHASSEYEQVINNMAKNKIWLLHPKLVEMTLYGWHENRQN